MPFTDPSRSDARYPAPDRSGYVPRCHATSGAAIVDLGWAEGRMSDGRPYRMELQARNGVATLTIFFSTRDLDQLTPASAIELLRREGLVRFGTGRPFVLPRTMVDASAREMWAVDVVLGDEDGTSVSAGVSMEPYAGSTSSDA